jgi:type IV fimbrial biogenesis protein FimT
MAFIDLDNDGQLDEGDGEQLLQSRVQGSSNVVVRYSQALDILRFNSNGNAIGSNGTFTFCDDRGAAEARGLIVSPVGSVRSAVASEADDSSHIVQDHENNDVSCS